MNPKLLLRFTFEEAQLDDRMILIDDTSEMKLGAEASHTNDGTTIEIRLRRRVRVAKCMLIVCLQVDMIEIGHVPLKVLAKTQVEFGLRVIVGGEIIVDDQIAIAVGDRTRPFQDESQQ